MAIMKMACGDQECCFCTSWHDPSFQALGRKYHHLQRLCLTDLAIVGCNYGYPPSGCREFSSIRFPSSSPITPVPSAAWRSQGGGQATRGVGAQSGERESTADACNRCWGQRLHGRHAMGKTTKWLLGSCTAKES